METVNRLSLLMPCMLCIAAFACGPSLRPVPVNPTDDADFAADPTPPKPGLVEDDAQPADTLFAGDIVSVRFLGATGLDQPSAPIDRSGRLHLPLVGDILVAGKSLSEAEAAIQKQVERYDRFARASISLTDPKGHLVTITGAVERPGNVAVVGDARLAEILASVGGPRLITSDERMVSLGDLDGTRVVRKGKVLPVDARLALEGNPRHNVRIRPGDIIYVPPALAGHVIMLGNVGRPRTMPYRAGMRLTEALADAGGFAKSADQQDVRILRGGFASPKLYVARAKDILNGRRPDVVLAPGDVVYVTEHWSATVSEVLERVVPASALVVVGTSLLTK
jgi:polysaccharide export outer membrane protein